MMIKEMKGNEKRIRRNISRIVALIVVFALVCALTAFAASPEVYNVDIYDGNEVTRVLTSRTDAFEIVAQAKIELNEDDMLNLDRFAVGQESIIIIYRAADIELVTADGNTQSVRFAGTVSDLLESRHIQLGEDYMVNYPLNTELVSGMKVTVIKSYTVFVSVDGATTSYKTGLGTVADVLEKAEITLSDNDEVVPDVNTELSDGLEISVNRVEYVTREQNEVVEFSKEKMQSTELYVGSSKIMQKGENGVKTVTYEDKYVNGKLQSSTVVNEVLVKQAVSQITAVGTKDKPVTVAAVKYGGSMISELSVPLSVKIENGRPVNYKRAVRGMASAYSCSSGSLTASGRPVMPGHVAVDPNQFPYGTKLWIVSDDGIVYGYSIAADTGGFVNKGKFTVDLFMNTEAECRSWGARNVTIYVL